MKIISIINKSIKEQIRNIWILILTVSIAPFFVVIYSLIDEGMSTSYKIIVVNNDRGYSNNDSIINYSKEFIKGLSYQHSEKKDILLKAKIYDDVEKAKQKLKEKKTDLVLIIPDDFSESITRLNQSRQNQVNIEFIGDLTDHKYLMAAIWTHNYISTFISLVAEIEQPIHLVETSIGISGQVSSFDLYVPGLLIFSIIMLMFSATVAIVIESEKQTIKRIKLSGVTALEFLGGISIVQVFVGVFAVLLTLIVAIALGFNISGSFLMLLIVAILCSISIIAFSLILAAFTKTVNEVLVIGNFPLFLFMFFSDVMFPINSSEIFSIGGYTLKFNFFLSSTHAVSALKKVLIMQESFAAIIPEISLLIVLTGIYFLIGVWLFNRRHLKAV